MTREKWAAMSDDEKRIKVLELWGWKDIHDNDYATCDIGEIGCLYRGTDPEGNHDVATPNPLEDLNACHEMEETGHRVDEHFVEKWLWQLALVLSNGETTDYADVGKWNLIHATAAQRAEAFALTMEME